MLDLGKTDLLIYAVISERSIRLPNELWGISDQVKFGVARNVQEVERFSSNATVLIKSYYYDVNNWIEGVQLA